LDAKALLLDADDIPILRTIATMRHAIGGYSMKRPFSAIAAAVLLASVCTGCQTLAKYFSSGNSSVRETEPAPERAEHTPYWGGTPKEQRDWLESEERADIQHRSIPH
jgi:hypothetical protein